MVTNLGPSPLIGKVVMIATPFSYHLLYSFLFIHFELLLLRETCEEGKYCHAHTKYSLQMLYLCLNDSTQ